jgi:hypothetical protein
MTVSSPVLKAFIYIYLQKYHISKKILSRYILEDAILYINPYHLTSAILAIFIKKIKL